MYSFLQHKEFLKLGREKRSSQNRVKRQNPNTKEDDIDDNARQARDEVITTENSEQDTQEDSDSDDDLVLNVTGHSSSDESDGGKQ